jgi:hypothetical protein
MGETINREDDMPGTLGVPVVFSNCRYHDFIVWKTPTLTTTPVTNTRPDKFGVQVTNNTEFELWDKTPH